MIMHVFEQFLALYLTQKKRKTIIVLSKLGRIPILLTDILKSLWVSIGNITRFVVRGNALNNLNCYLEYNVQEYTGFLNDKLKLS